MQTELRKEKGHGFGLTRFSVFERLCALGRSDTIVLLVKYGLLSYASVMWFATKAKSSSEIIQPDTVMDSLNRTAWHAACQLRHLRALLVEQRLSWAKVVSGFGLGIGEQKNCVGLLVVKELPLVLGGFRASLNACVEGTAVAAIAAVGLGAFSSAPHALHGSCNGDAYGDACPAWNAREAQQRFRCNNGIVYSAGTEQTQQPYSLEVPPPAPPVPHASSGCKPVVHFETN